VDASNLENVVKRLLDAVKHIKFEGIKVIPGVELTYILPAKIQEFAGWARSLGAKLVLVHGQSPVEPVPEGTNTAALLSAVDVLCHPGLLTKEEARLAAKNGVFLEITSKNGHCFANGHVAKIAKEAGASLIFASDAHTPSQLLSPQMIEKVLLGAGLSQGEVEDAYKAAERLLEKVS
jgi:histidinol phosphatase-like PHP family hydrolase